MNERNALRRAQRVLALMAAGLSAGLFALAHILDIDESGGWLLVTFALCMGAGSLGALLLSRRALTNAVEPLQKMASLAASASQFSASLQAEQPQQASVDPLTGLPNRAFFEGRLARNLKGLGKRQGYLAVLYIDVDHFQQLNDRYGYDAADEVLIRLAGRVRAQLRENDLLVRLEGDEFAVLLHLEQAEQARQIADNVIASAYAPIVLPDGGEASASLSVGLALVSESECSPAGVLEEAHVALLHAKRQGRGRLHQTQPIPL
ncbi:GGDEF domain-containing protein [Pseudomonas putida]